jgi:uncharacterized protein (TIGR00661 family)
MDQSKTAVKPNILIAPLDWGLGHATRCIPLINTLIRKNCTVFIASEGKIKSLLYKEFPQLFFIDLKGYNIQYSKNSWALPFAIGRQIPKIIATIQQENQRLKEIVKEHAIHGVISDNRYGFYHEGVPSVFITHQLRIKSGFGKIADDYLQILNYKYINQFSQCWVPDYENHPNLAGELSHPLKKPLVPVKYIGALSRFTHTEPKLEKHLLILLSGPEPQRTVLENSIIEQLKNYKGSVMLLRGLPEEENTLELPANITMYNHLSTDALNKTMNEASLVVSRCGFSTIMDLAVFGKKSILIPTPGQTEQEYLAKHLMKLNFALCIPQNKFRLEHALDLACHFDYHTQGFGVGNNLDSVTDDFIHSVKTLM